MADIIKTTMIEDLAKVQGNLPNIKKDAKGNFGKYVTLDAIHEAVLPLLAKHNLAWVTLPTYDENGEPILDYKLLHTSGDKLEGKMRMYVDKQTPQGQGSSITYARRYSICAVIGITADDDDDGTAGSAKPTPAYTKRVTPAPTHDPQDEPSRDIRSDLHPIDGAQITSLMGAVKLKGITDREQAIEILNHESGLKDFRDLPDSEFILFYKKIKNADPGELIIDNLKEPF